MKETNEQKGKKSPNWLGTVLSLAGECRRKMVISVLCAIISVAGGIVPYVGVYQIIILFFAGEQTVNGVLFWAAIALAGYIVKLAFYALSTMLAHLSAYAILENMRNRIADRLMKAPLGTVLNQPVGSLKSVMIDRVETIELPLAHLIPEGISNLLLPLGVLAYLVIIDWRMALAAMATVPVAVVAYAFMIRTFNQKYADYMESSNYVNSVIVEYIEGIEVIKAFNQSTSSYEKYQKAVESFQAYTLDWFRSTWKLMNFGGAVLPSTLLGTMPVGMLLYLNGTLNPTELTMALILSLGIIAPLTSFTVFVNDLKAIEYAVQEADEFLRLSELESAAERAELQRYDIELKEVSFAYDAGEDAAGNPDNSVIHDVHLKIPQGSFTALVGPSGGGKSTLARLIARFWDVGSGAITIGDVNVKRLPLEQLADSVSFVTQDNFLFNCSLMENIRLGNPGASDAEVIRAAQAACCDEFIGRLDRGYDTDAGEAGRKLSGGEKQRIAIARTILKNAPVIILDEATAFTDPENEDQLQRSISALIKGKTLLVIAHRLSTIKNADQIAVMNKGRVIATGTHRELLAGSGLYKDMWEAHIGAKQWAAGGGKGELRQYV
jgi:ABC-type multidrug transport system, ATPase and permease components